MTDKDKLIDRIPRKRIVTPAGIELTLESEKHAAIHKYDKVLSVGCGTGEIEEYLAQKYGCEMTGVDINEAAVKLASKKSVKNLHFETGNGENLSFQDESFDIVYSSGAIGGFFDKGILEAYRVLKKNGILILIEVVFMGNMVPKDIWNIWTNRKIKVLSRESLIWELEKTGFKDVYNRVYYEPAWWEIYYSDRGGDPAWIEERNNYLKFREYIGIGLFIFEKGNIPVVDGFQI